MEPSAALGDGRWGHIFEDFRVRLPAMLSFLYRASEERNELIPRIAIAGAAAFTGSLRLDGPTGPLRLNLRSVLNLRGTPPGRSATPRVGVIHSAFVAVRARPVM
jgi:hypothetical protein